MTHELLYTSAPQGLKPGSRGFCTVEMTEGLPPGLADRLESLSGYRQAFAIHDPRARDNPVNFSHLILQAAGKRYHVLSRVADAGQDYTGRSNKLAHHVALEPEERPAANPAWVLSRPGFAETNWEATPRVLPAGRAVPRGARPAAVCRAWQAAAGDAGWAGVLAASALEPGGKSLSVIFPAGLDVLPLVDEALALLPAERQWDVTFSTYFTKLPAGIECQWRFVLDETPEAQMLRRNPHATAIDLCRLRGAAPGGALVDAARTGRVPDVRPPALERPDSVFLRPGAAGSPAPAASTAPATHAGTLAPAAALAVETSTPGLPSAGPGTHMPPALAALLPSAQRKKSRSLLLTIIAAVSLLAGGVMAAVYLAGPEPEALAERGPTTGNAPPPMVPAVDREAGERQRREAERRRAEEEEAARRRIQEQVAKRDPPEPEQGAVVSEPPPDLDGGPPAIERQPSDRSPLSDLRRSDRPRIAGKYPLLELPKRNFGLSLNADRGPAELAKVFVTSLAECELTLAGSEVVLGSGRRYDIKPGGADSRRVWTISLKRSNSFAASEIATLSLEQDSLRFQWSATAPPGVDAEALRFCLLNVIAGGEQQTCALGRPEIVPTFVLDMNSKLNTARANGAPIPLPVPHTANRHLHVDLWIEAPRGQACRLAWRGRQGNYHAIGGQDGEYQQLRRPDEADADLASRRCNAIPLAPAGSPESEGRIRNPLLQALIGKPRVIPADPRTGTVPQFRSGDAPFAGSLRPEERNACVGFNVSLARGAEDGDLELTAETVLFPRKFEVRRGNPNTYAIFEVPGGESWNRGDFEKALAEIDKQRVMLTEELEKVFNRQVREHLAAVRRLERTVPALQMDRDLENARQTLKRWENAQRSCEDALRLVEENEKWCQQMRKIFGSIEGELQIGYRVYLIVDGLEVDLVRTAE